MITCSECSSQDSGSCHRHPPTVIITSNGTESVWPTVLPTDWCGDASAIQTTPVEPV